MMTIMIILTVVLVVLATAAAIIALGAHRWTKETRELHARLEAARLPVHPRSIDLREIKELPTPVNVYFRAAIREGWPMVAGVRVRHQGSINMSEKTDRWRPFTSEQQVITCRPGFDWDGRVRMIPGLTVRVHDAYVAGEGILHASLLGMFTIVDLRGSRDIAEGELIRFFAEAAWYPTALLPSQGVRWEAVDARSARAIFREGTRILIMVFTFDTDGMIETVRTEARCRTVGKKMIPTPWQGRFWNYEERAGMLVPLDCEVAWLLPEGARPYWRGRITEIAYDFAV